MNEDSVNTRWFLECTRWYKRYRLATGKYIAPTANQKSVITGALNRFRRCCAYLKVDWRSALDILDKTTNQEP